MRADTLLSLRLIVNEAKKLALTNRRGQIGSQDLAG
jgi:hypothetical protein